VRIHAIFGGIGAFAVKFRWVVIAAWLIAAFRRTAFPAVTKQRHSGQQQCLPARQRA
jgi:hypothetical protein